MRRMTGCDMAAYVYNPITRAESTAALKVLQDFNNEPGRKSYFCSQKIKPPASSCWECFIFTRLQNNKGMSDRIVISSGFVFCVVSSRSWLRLSETTWLFSSPAQWPPCSPEHRVLQPQPWRHLRLTLKTLRRALFELQGDQWMLPER